MSRSILVEELAVGHFKEIDQGAPVTPVALLRADQMLDRGRGNLRREIFDELLEARLLLLPGDTQIPDADFPGVGHLRVTPDAGMLAGVDGDPDALAKVNGLTAGHADHLVQRDARFFHDPNRLVTSDDPGPGILGDPFGPVEMVEMRMPDDDPVGLIDVVGTQPCPLGAFGPINVGIEKNGEPRRLEAKGRTAIPIENGPRFAQEPIPIFI